MNKDEAAVLLPKWRNRLNADGLFWNTDDALENAPKWQLVPGVPPRGSSLTVAVLAALRAAGPPYRSLRSRRGPKQPVLPSQRL
jgi:hypothetical protein